MPHGFAPIRESLTALVQQEVILVAKLLWSARNEDVIIAKEILKARQLENEKRGRGRREVRGRDM